MNVLFVCKYNRFRSKLAEAFFNKLGKKHLAKSAGIIKGPPIDEAIRHCAHQNGVEINGVPKMLDVSKLNWSDMIVIVADDVQTSSLTDKFPNMNKMIRKWDIHDTSNKNTAEMNRIAKLIRNKVLELIAEIDK